MRGPRLLITLLIVAAVLVDVVVLSVVASARGLPPQWPHPGVLVLFALSMSQVSLAALWTGLGGRSLYWRVGGLMLCAVLWSRYMAWIIAPERIDDYASLYGSLLLAQTIAILVPLSVARLRGLKLVREGDVDCVEDTTGGRSGLQFSLREMFSWTTTFAVVLGALRCTVDHRLLPSYLSDWRDLTVLSLDNALLALAALWAVLGTGRPALRALILVLATAAAITTGGALAHVDVLWPFAALCLIQVLWLLASLCVFRVAGYRVVGRAEAGWEGPLSPEEA